MSSLHRLADLEGRMAQKLGRTSIGSAGLLPVDSEKVFPAEREPTDQEEATTRAQDSFLSPPNSGLGSSQAQIPTTIGGHPFVGASLPADAAVVYRTVPAQVMAPLTVPSLEPAWLPQPENGQGLIRPQPVAIEPPRRRLQEMRAYQPGLRDRIRDNIQAGLMRFGVDRYDALQAALRIAGDSPHAEDGVNSIVDFVPFLGDAVSVEDASEHYGAGNYVQAAVSGGGVLIGGLIPAARLFGRRAPRRLPPGARRTWSGQPASDIAGIGDQTAQTLGAEIRANGPLAQPVNGRTSRLPHLGVGGLPLDETVADRLQVLRESMNQPQRQLDQIGAPATVGRADLSDIVLRARAADVRGDPSIRFVPSGEYTLFGSVDDRLREHIPPVGPRGERPSLPPGILPNEGHWARLAEQRDAVADTVAGLVRDHGGPIPTRNYSLDPLVQAGIQSGLPRDQAILFRHDLAAAEAAASIGRRAGDDLRNASLLMHRRASGLPLSSPNPIGYNLLPVHGNLYSQLYAGDNFGWRAPKATTFNRMMLGETQEALVDRNDRRLLMTALGAVNNGRLERDAFVSDAAYLRAMRTGDIRIEDLTIRAPTRTVNGVTFPSGYLVEADVMQDVARRLETSPAELHGNIRELVPPMYTGLRSHGRLLQNLEDRIEGNARAWGTDKSDALAQVVRHRTPLRADVGTAGALGFGAAGALYAFAPSQAEAAPFRPADFADVARQARVNWLAHRLMSEQKR